MNFVRSLAKRLEETGLKEAEIGNFRSDNFK